MTFVEKANDANWKFRMEAQFIPRATSQMNTGVETPIQVCHARARSLQASKNVPKQYKNGTYPAAFMLSMQLEGLKIIDMMVLLKQE